MNYFYKRWSKIEWMEIIKRFSNTGETGRGSHKNHLKGPKKRTEEDDKRFAQSFERLVLVARAQEGD